MGGGAEAATPGTFVPGVVLMGGTSIVGTLLGPEGSGGAFRHVRVYVCACGRGVLVGLLWSWVAFGHTAPASRHCCVCGVGVGVRVWVVVWGCCLRTA